MFDPDRDPTETGFPTTPAPPADQPPPAADAAPAFEPAPVEPVEPLQPAEPAPTSPGPVRPMGGVRTIVTAAVLSAVLASGGTGLVLDATGALNRAAPAGGSGAQASNHQAVTLDESSAIIDVAAKV